MPRINNFYDNIRSIEEINQNVEFIDQRQQMCIKEINVINNDLNDIRSVLNTYRWFSLLVTIDLIFNMMIFFSYF